MISVSFTAALRWPLVLPREPRPTLPSPAVGVGVSPTLPQLAPLFRSWVWRHPYGTGLSTNAVCLNNAAYTHSYYDISQTSHCKIYGLCIQQLHQSSRDGNKSTVIYILLTGIRKEFQFFCPAWYITIALSFVFLCADIFRNDFALNLEINSFPKQH